MPQPVNPRVTKALIESARASNEIARSIRVLAEQVAALSVDPATKASLDGLFNRVQHAVNQQVQAANDTARD